MAALDDKYRLLSREIEERTFGQAAVSLSQFCQELDTYLRSEADPEQRRLGLVSSLGQLRSALHSVLAARAHLAFELKQAQAVRGYREPQSRRFSFQL